MRIVLDTNVLVSALLNPSGLPAAVLTLVLNGEFKLLYDNRILLEYTEVLWRPVFDFKPDTVTNLLEYVKTDGEFVSALPQKIKFIDVTDKKFYEVYKSGGAEYLVTGNGKHYPQEKGIVTPRVFLELI
ncbi:putative PIN domain protein [Candidatus Termititenax dinenymphae]|uniref:PIN domain protein n=1 Tax=Candidatus Termititenax dinenymphae TaxID=2218523 RepID=A0A388TKI0_9BACT|nr:putative PIN domain protein [Candidatus Termititenax dinenymphae]